MQAQDNMPADLATGAQATDEVDHTRLAADLDELGLSDALNVAPWERHTIATSNQPVDHQERRRELQARREKRAQEKRQQREARQRAYAEEIARRQQEQHKQRETQNAQWLEQQRAILHDGEAIWARDAKTFVVPMEAHNQAKTEILQQAYAQLYTAATNIEQPLDIRVRQIAPGGAQRIRPIGIEDDTCQMLIPDAIFRRVFSDALVWYARHAYELNGHVDILWPSERTPRFAPMGGIYRESMHHARALVEFDDRWRQLSGADAEQDHKPHYSEEEEQALQTLLRAETTDRAIYRQAAVETHGLVDPRTVVTKATVLLERDTSNQSLRAISQTTSVQNLQ